MQSQRNGGGRRQLRHPNPHPPQAGIGREGNGGGHFSPLPGHIHPQGGRPPFHIGRINGHPTFGHGGIVPGRNPGNPFAGGNNPFSGGGNPNNYAHQGLGGILEMLSGGISQDQLNNLMAGYTGANGAVGGAHGAFRGLSPWAVHFLAQQMTKQAPTLVDTSGLTGDALFQANLKNALANMQPAKYTLGGNMTADQLGQLFANGIGGHSAYAAGYGANGKLGMPMPGGGIINGIIQGDGIPGHPQPL